MIWYRLVVTLLAPVFLGALVYRVLRGREGFDDIRERLGRGVRNGDPCLWLHGASNGEITSGRVVIDALRKEFPDHPILVTANTVSARDMVRGWAMAGVTAQLAPLDFRWALWRFRRCARPVALLVLENEIWPNRIATASEPVVVIAARVSEKAARVWARFPGIGRAVSGKLGLVLPQDPRSAARLGEIGVEDVAMGSQIELKSSVYLPAPDADELASLSKVFDRENTVLAASTHDGEDGAIITAFVAALKSRSDLKLILAPRHPARAAAIEQVLKDAGLNWARRSDGGALTERTTVLLADTLGEMPIWYALASVVFVAGSLVTKGGHTPFEPIKAGCAVVHGPFVENFADIYGVLEKAGASRLVRNETELTNAFIQLKAPIEIAAMTKMAEKVVEQTVSEDSIAQLIEYLHRQLG